MPRQRPRSEMSSSTSLIGLVALARRVLVELVEHDEDQRARGAERLLLLEHPLQHGADHEALGAVVQGVDVDDADLPRLPVEQVAVAPAHVLAADQVRHMARRAACRRRSKAATVPAPPAGPDLGQADVLAVAAVVSASTSASKLSIRRPSISIQGSRAVARRPRQRRAWPRCGRRRSRAGSRRPRPRRTGSAAGARARTRAGSRRRTARPRCGCPCRAGARASSRADRRQELHARRTAPRAGPASRRPRGSSAESAAFGWSRNSRSSPFTLKTSACVLAASPPRAPAREEAVEQEASRSSSWWRRRRCPRC